MPVKSLIWLIFPHGRNGASHLRQQHCKAEKKIPAAMLDQLCWAARPCSVFFPPRPPAPTGRRGQSLFKGGWWELVCDVNLAHQSLKLAHPPRHRRVGARVGREKQDSPTASPGDNMATTKAICCRWETSPVYFPPESGSAKLSQQTAITRCARRLMDASRKIVVNRPCLTSSVPAWRIREMV